MMFVFVPHPDLHLTGWWLLEAIFLWWTWRSVSFDEDFYDPREDYDGC